MRFAAGTAAFAACVLFQPALAHYRFFSFVAPNGTTTDAYQYVRQNTNYNSPAEDATSTDMRCNVGGLASGNTTSTYTVDASDEVGFHADIVVFHLGSLGVFCWYSEGRYLRTHYLYFRHVHPESILPIAVNIA